MRVAKVNSPGKIIIDTPSPKTTTESPTSPVVLPGPSGHTEHNPFLLGMSLGGRPLCVGPALYLGFGWVAETWNLVPFPDFSGQVASMTAIHHP